MKRIVISGYYGFDNLGDEAVLYSIINGLWELDPQLHITVLSSNPVETAKRYQVEAISRTNPWQIIRALQKAQLLISGGGSLLQDVTGPYTVAYYLGVVLLAKLLGKKVMYYAQGIGPIKSRWNQSLVKIISNRVDIITVRDQASKALLQNLGVTALIEVTADSVFTLTKAQGLPGRQVLTSLNITKVRPLVGIAVRDWPDLLGYRKALAAAADKLIEAGWQVIFIPFHFPHDSEPARAIAAHMNHPVTIIDRALAIPEALGLTAELELVIGMRLHALIFAAVMQVPLVGIAYDPKVTAFVKSLNQEPVGSSGTVGTKELQSKIEEVLANRKQMGGELAEVVQSLRKAAKTNPLKALEESL